MYIKYRSHVQNVGTTEFVSDGRTSGTTGKSLRLESVDIAIVDNANLGVSYRSHIQDKGWLDWISSGWSGTIGKALRMEALQIKLTGSDAKNYDIWYRTHAEGLGWLDWAKNGEISGTVGGSKRIEAIQILVLKAGLLLSNDTAETFLKNTQNNPTTTPSNVVPSKSFVERQDGGAWFAKPGSDDDWFTEHFQRGEFKCDCGGSCDGYNDTRMSCQVVDCLETIRDYFVKNHGATGVSITSGIRCPSYNASVGGIDGSLHCYGEAADMYIIGVSMDTWVQEKIAEIANDCGCGCIKYAVQRFCHIQIEPCNYWLEV